MRRLAAVNDLDVAGQGGQQPTRCQPIDDDHVRGGNEAPAPYGDQIGISGPASHQGDRSVRRGRVGRAGRSPTSRANAMASRKRRSAAWVVSAGHGHREPGLLDDCRRAGRPTCRMIRAYAEDADVARRTARPPH